MKKFLSTTLALLIAGTALVAQTGNIVTMKTSKTSDVRMLVAYTGSGTIKANGKDMNNGSWTNDIIPAAGDIVISVSGSIVLTELTVSEQAITEINVSKAIYLTYLSCSENQLTSLDVTKNTALTNLNCTINNLTELDVTQNTALQILGFYNNPISEIDVTNNPAITDLYCNNLLSSLDLRNSAALTYLYANGQEVEVSVPAGATTFPNPIFYHNKTAVEYVKINGISYQHGASVPMPSGNTVSFTTDNTITGSPFSGTITIVYVAPTVQVTFNSYGGTYIAPMNITAGTAIGTVFCERENYILEGWYTEAAYINKWNVETDIVSSDMSLHAKWTPTTGIEDITTSSINIYPNPANNYIFVDGLNAGDKISITNIAGVKLMEVKANADTQYIDVSSLRSGMYIISAGNKTGKILVSD